MELGLYVRFAWPTSCTKQLSHLLKMENFKIEIQSFWCSLGKNGNFWSHQVCLFAWQPWTVVACTGQGLCSHLPAFYPDLQDVCGYWWFLKGHCMLQHQKAERSWRASGCDLNGHQCLPLSCRLGQWEEHWRGFQS